MSWSWFWWSKPDYHSTKQSNSCIQSNVFVFRRTQIDWLTTINLSQQQHLEFRSSLLSRWVIRHSIYAFKREDDFLGDKYLSPVPANWKVITFSQVYSWDSQPHLSHSGSFFFLIYFAIHQSCECVTITRSLERGYFCEFTPCHWARLESLCHVTTTRSTGESKWTCSFNLLCSKFSLFSLFTWTFEWEFHAHERKSTR